ncbi:hypothetical protein SCWH03_55390 [Streptomyces pacificus]|uniref:Uncharacterized protein n=1 Tax=Streptomyces pacificus TaxID=2705029 RepID=A0A6A0B4P8_9ACTN|nr:hypothetical protein SCWH03_55390 [Streptomyces pacificus]
MPRNPVVAELISQACETRGWGPSELARALGMAESGDPRRLQRQHARRWMTGERSPEHWWPYIAQVLNLDPELINLPETGPGELLTDTVASVLCLGRSDGAPWKAHVDRVEVRDLRLWAVAAAQ